MTDIIKNYHDLELELGLESETAIALLVLADAVERAGTFSPSNAQNFGHELAMALKHVLEHTSRLVNVGDPVKVESL